MTVTFLRPYADYSPGQSASFTQDTEDSLVQQNIAQRTGAAALRANSPFEALENRASTAQASAEIANGSTADKAIVAGVVAGAGGSSVYMPTDESAGLVGTWEAYGSRTLNGASIAALASWGAGLPLAQPIAASQPVLTSNRAVFDGVNDVLVQSFDKGTATQSGGPIYLPDGGLGAAPGKGWTNTGLYAMKVGANAGRWLVGNDGRANSGSSSTPSVIILSADFSTIIAQFALPAGGSVQGVCEAPDGTIYAVFSVLANRIYQLSADLSTQLNMITLSFAANALGFDTRRTALIAGDNGAPNARWLNPANGATLFQRSLSNSPDQFYYEEAGDILWFAGGANGVAGKLRRYDVTNAITLNTYTMPGLLATEGVAFRDGVWYLCSDEYFHLAGASDYNLIRRYTLTPAGGTSIGTRFCAVFVGRVLQPSSNAIILAADNPFANTGSDVGVNDIGCAILKVANNTTDLLFTAASGATSALRSSVTFTAPDMTVDDAIYALDVDWAAKTVALYVNSVQVGTTQSLPNIAATVAPQNARVSLGAGIESEAIARPSRTIAAAASIVRGNSRLRTEGRFAWAIGRPELLPTTHPYRYSRPIA